MLNQFPNELNVGNLSAITMWTEFTKDLQLALDHHKKIPIQHRQINSISYMSLHSYVIQFFNKYVKPVQKAQPSLTAANTQLAEFYIWFEPFVMNSLDDHDDMAMEYLHRSYEKDKVENGFKKISEHAMWSHSVYDAFKMLTECLQTLQKLQCPIPEVHTNYMRRFSLTLTKLLLAYANTIRREFNMYTKDEKVNKSKIKYIIFYFIFFAEFFNDKQNFQKFYNFFL